MELTEKLLNFIEASPSVYHAIDTLRKRLCAAGYTELYEKDAWTLTAGGRYFVTRGSSSLVAFRLPSGTPDRFVMAAAHSDSPTFKLKAHPERAGAYTLSLSTERYGGMLLSSWLDRPLSVAGRIFVTENGKVVEKLVNLDSDFCIIPSVAIHMNRAANDGCKYDAHIDTLPLYGEAGSTPFSEILADAAKVRAADILSHDLTLYLRGRGTTLGAHGEFLAAPKLDDLECVFALTEGFLAAGETDAIPICAVFDNEEVGSATRQGAASTLLRDLIARIVSLLSISEEDKQRMLAGSFLCSADNAHAVHPNHPEYADPDNAPHMNGGVVIKYNANRRYATDGASAAYFKALCARAGVPVQTYANRSDLAGGSTLGSIAETNVPVPTVDIGLAQLAMHAAYETAGSADLAYLVRAVTEYFSE